MIDYPTRVLLGTDGTESSSAAARTAVALCAKTGAELHVVHVWRLPSGATGTSVSAGSLPTASPEEALRSGQALLDGQVEEIRELGGEVGGTYLRMGQPPYEVVGLSDEIHADMLVIGRGRPRAMRRAVSGATGRPALGRAADYIVRSAHCPVLVAHGDGAPHAPAPHEDATEARAEEAPL